MRTKVVSLKKINKIHKPLARLTKKKDLNYENHQKNWGYYYRPHRNKDYNTMNK